MAQMLVETYECEEVAPEKADGHSAAALEIVQRLGLEGQQRLTCDAGPEPQRSPYRKATKDEMFVMRMLAPKQEKLKQYDDSPIPLRVLQVASHAESLGLFKELQIWSADSQVIKDPFLLGVTKHPRNTWQDEHWLLARWGEHLDEWPALVRKATELWREKATAALKKVIASANYDLARVETFSDMHGHIDFPSYYWLGA